MYIYIYIYIYIDTHMYIHTHIYICTYIPCMNEASDMDHSNVSMVHVMVRNSHATQDACSCQEVPEVADRSPQSFQRTF